MSIREVDTDYPGIFAERFSRIPGRPRLDVDPEKVEQGLAQLVLSVVELLRRLLERQAIRRMEAGTLSDEETDRIGAALMRLELKIKELQEVFQIEDLNVNLGPLGNLLD